MGRAKLTTGSTRRLGGVWVTRGQRGFRALGVMAIIPTTGFFAVSAPAEAGFSVGFSSVQHLTTGPYDSDVTVAPDGNRLVFTRSGQLWTAMADGSQPTRINLPFGYVFRTGGLTLLASHHRVAHWVHA